MRIAWWMVGASVLLGCGGDDVPTSSTSSGTATSTSTGTGGGGGAGGAACAAAASIQIAGQPLPGATVELSLVLDPPTAGPYEIAWTVSKGTLSASTGAVVSWTVPADVATDVPETADVTATATASTCPPVNASATAGLDWPAPLRTVVLFDPNVPGSSDVADHYAASRGIPADHLCAVTSPDPTTLPGADLGAFLAAVGACTAAVGPHVHYLVPVYGVPYKVSDRIGDLANAATKVTVSLDALLVYGAAAEAMSEAVFNGLYRTGDSMTGVFEPFVPFGELRAAGSDERFLVARIDGADAGAAKALVDRTAAAETLAAAGKLAGTVYVDGNEGLPHPATDDFGSYESGEWNIIGVEKVFTDDGTYPVVADYNGEEFGTAPALLLAPDALYYAGWYSFGHYNDVFTWNPGAIGGHLDSCSACDIRGDVDWSARALRKGITATFGAVNEPYVAGMPEYDQLFAYLLAGASYGEAGYEATRVGAWMMVWVGDPLYRPYPPPAP